MTLDKLFLTLSFVMCKTRVMMTTLLNFCENRDYAHSMLCSAHNYHSVCGYYFYEGSQCKLVCRGLPNSHNTSLMDKSGIPFPTH